MQPQGMVPQQLAQQGQPPQQQQPITAVANDLVSLVRSLVYELKKCLSNLMAVTANTIVHNSQIDTGARTTESKAARFDKSLEEFFSLCNQIERHLVSENNESEDIDIHSTPAIHVESCFPLFHYFQS